MRGEAGRSRPHGDALSCADPSPFYLDVGVLGVQLRVALERLARQGAVLVRDVREVAVGVDGRGGGTTAGDAQVVLNVLDALHMRKIARGMSDGGRMDLQPIDTDAPPRYP